MILNLGIKLFLSRLLVDDLHNLNMEENVMDFGVMVLSSDGYSDLWPIFFQQFKKNWPSFNGTLFLNTENVGKKLSDSNKYGVTLPKQSFSVNTPWAERLFKCLTEMDEEYVLLLLDDFILTDFVDYEEINKCVNYMKEDHDIACFNFRPTKGKAVEQGFKKYELKDKKSPFRINLQAGIWRKSFLLEFIRKHENPWQFETWGNMRARRFGDKIYHTLDSANEIVMYPEGGIVADKRWRGEDTIDLLKELGFEYLIPNREIYYPDSPRKTEIMHRTFIQKVIQVIKSLI